MNLLHGEETLTIFKPVKHDTKYTIQSKLIDVQDKGKGAVLISDAVIKETDTNEIQSIVRSSSFVRGLGGFGYKGTVRNPFLAVPTR